MEVIQYNCEKSINLFNFVKNNFNWDFIKKWQNDKNIKFPLNTIKKNTKKDNEIINFLIGYPIEFDVNNKDINIDDDYIYKNRIEFIKKQINLFKPIKNPDIEIFKIFDEPLFHYFIQKNIPNNSIDSLKKPSGIFSITLKPVYNNFIDMNIIKTKCLLMYNDKNVLISDSKYSSAMSFPHFLCIPSKRIYNCVTLDKEDITLLKDMMNDSQNYFNKSYLKCLSEFGARCLKYMLENPNKIINNFDLIERNDIANIFIKKLNEIHTESKNKNNYDIKVIYENLLNTLEKTNLKNANKNLDFYFHIHPFHGIGYLHMQCIYSPLKTKSWNHFINQFIDVNDVIKILEEKII